MCAYARIDGGNISYFQGTENGILCLNPLSSSLYCYLDMRQTCNKPFHHENQTSDTETPFLDLNSSIFNDIIYDKQGDFDLTLLICFL